MLAEASEITSSQMAEATQLTGDTLILPSLQGTTMHAVLIQSFFIASMHM